ELDQDLARGPERLEVALASHDQPDPGTGHAASSSRGHSLMNRGRLSAPPVRREVGLAVDGEVRGKREAVRGVLDHVRRVDLPEHDAALVRAVCPVSRVLVRAGERGAYVDQPER